MGTQIPLPKGRSPQFSAHICCGQMAAWIKMPLGVELYTAKSVFLRQICLANLQKYRFCRVCLSPGDFVLDGDLARPLSFRPMFIIVIVFCRPRVKRLYACYMPAPRFTICVLVIIEFGLNILGNPVTLLHTDVVCAKNRLQQVQSYRYCYIF